MNRKLITCLLAGTMALSSLGMIVSAEETTEAATVVAVDTDSEALSDDIYSFQLKLNGELYTFPMSCADFIARGWECSDEDASYEIEPNSYMSIVFKKDGLKVYATVYNLGLNTVSAADASLGGISMDSWQFEDAPETVMELPGGITYNVSTLDDITAAYGPASDTYEGERYTKLSYEYDFYQDWDLYVSTETGLLNEVEVRNMIEDADANAAAAAEVSNEPTEAVLAYTAPTELSAELDDFVVEYAGDLYQLAAPVSAFLENGWTLKPDSDSVVAGGSYGWVYIMKDNQEYHTTARNYDKNATTIENCFISDLTADVNNTNLPMTIAGGITMGMSEADLLTALDGIDYELDSESDYFNYYKIEIEEYSSYYSIRVAKETSTVSSIEAEND